MIKLIGQKSKVAKKMLLTQNSGGNLKIAA
jgi:hypothetical protein